MLHKSTAWLSQYSLCGHYHCAHISLSYALVELESWCHINRFVWNHFLAANQTKYADERKFKFYYEMNAAIPGLKKQLEFLRQPPAQSLQGICQRLESAIKRVWQTKSGFPHFKSKKKGDLPSIYIPQQNNHIKWDKNSVKIPKLGKASPRLALSVATCKSSVCPPRRKAE